MQAEVVNKKNLSDLDILQFIPQRDPMVMVSGLQWASDHAVTTWFLIKEGNIFLKDGRFREEGLIENIAQSGAALNGYHAMVNKEPVKNGYIGGIKNLEVHSLPETGVRLTTSVTETYHVMDTSIIVGEVRVDDQLIARCEMKVFLQP